MHSLIELDVGGTAKNQVSTSISKKHSLSLALCSSASRPRKAPPTVGLFTTVSKSLVTLSLTGCGLSGDLIPNKLGDFSMLQNLLLSDNPIHSLPQSIKELTKLQKLKLENCGELEYIPEMPASLTTLTVYKCKSLNKLSNLPNLLKTLDFLALCCNKLIEVQGMFQLKSILAFDADFIDVLGLANLTFLSEAKVDLYNNLTLTRWEGPVQGLYEFGIFSTSLHGSKLPGWLSYKSTGSSISFDMPSRLGMSFQGLNIYVNYEEASIYYSIRRNKFWNEFHVRVANKNKDLRWTYNPTFTGLLDRGADITWLCHLKLGDHLDAGDTLSISVSLVSSFQLKELGVHIVYKRNERNLRCKATPPAHHLINGVDISAYQVREGSYFLCHFDFDIHQERSIDGWDSRGWYEFLFNDDSEDVAMEVVPSHNASTSSQKVCELLPSTVEDDKSCLL